MQETTNPSIGLGRSGKIFLTALVVWILAQLIRFIAIPLITRVANGIDAPSWMYPAILDVVTAILAVPLAIAIWKWRGYTVWTLTIVYFTLSIVDHIGALTNLTLIGEPIAFEQFNGGGNPYAAPVVQTVLDVVFFGLLFMPRFRGLFFQLSKPKN
ncbi:hypothetical protein AB9F29_05840 [Falsihalocynthiibacter sp. S25ZX9]|uniref:hypothetical protein n=1 Tax=Falsihalocynthiibacter sp. S25ZX9 TaxID=3240870 RepID=UPI00350FDED0